MNIFDHKYAEALRVVLEKGEDVGTRAILLSTGRKVAARSVIGYGFDIDVSLLDGWGCTLPLLTTKKVDYIGKIVPELLWFISGSTNEQDLARHDVHIWKQWAGPDGELGPVYGAAWRRYEGKNKVVDQLACLIEGVRAVVKDPTASVGRRLIVNAWDPTRLDEMALPPCHVMFQVFVRGNALDMLVYQRSGDLFLGVPYNVASYATLLNMIAYVCELRPRHLHYRFGDLHLYENHFDQAEEQRKRVPFDSPILHLGDYPLHTPFDIDSFDVEDFFLTNYRHHPALRGEVAV